jgi:hypothetical protein
VSDMKAWLAERDPPPPPDLAEALEPEIGGLSLEASLTEAGLSRLDQALTRPGRIRESAFRLLEADALLTYACEAALDAEDPQGALRRILSAIGS